MNPRVMRSRDPLQTTKRGAEVAATGATSRNAFPRAPRTVQPVGAAVPVQTSASSVSTQGLSAPRDELRLLASFCCCIPFDQTMLTRIPEAEQSTICYESALLPVWEIITSVGVRKAGDNQFYSVAQVQRCLPKPPIWTRHGARSWRNDRSCSRWRKSWASVCCRCAAGNNCWRT